MNRQPKSFLLIAVCLVVASVVSPSLGQVATAGKLLRWKLETGQVFDVLVVQEMQQQQNIGGQEMDSSTNMRMEMTWEVLDVDADGVISVSQSLDRVIMKATTPVGEIAYDSASEEEPQGLAAMLAGTMKPMIGAEFVQKMTPRGESLSVELPEGMEAEGAAMQGPASPAMLKQMMSSATLPLPEYGVEEGTEWTDEATVDLPQVGKVAMNRTFTYAGEVERESRTLDAIDMEMETNFGEGGANAMGMKMTVKDQETSGTLFFDADAGYLAGSEVTQKMNMTIEAMGETIDQVQTSKTITTVTLK